MPVNGMTITVASPPTIDGQEGRQILAAFYCELLGMQIIREDWLKIAKDKDSVLHLALDSDGWSDQRPPKWADPEHPQQMHLDILVPDVEAAGKTVVAMGASLLADNVDFRIYADPAGHPFCLYPDATAPAGASGVVGRLVHDCFRPRSVARFYEGLFGLDTRLEDTPERVVIDLGDERFPNFGFQHAVFVACRWPDDAYPAQFHIDVGFSDGQEAAQQRARQLGGIELPMLADTHVFADPAGHPFCL